MSSSRTSTYGGLDIKSRDRNTLAGYGYRALPTFVGHPVMSGCLQTRAREVLEIIDPDVNPTEIFTQNR